MQSDVKPGGVNTAAISHQRHCRLVCALAATQEHELVSEWLEKCYCLSLGTGDIASPKLRKEAL